jgi:hypothetical protein
LIKEATPLFRQVEEREPAARAQNLYQRLFSMDISPDMDRFYRQENFGGFSGYDILGSLEAPEYRERQGESIVNYRDIPVRPPAAQLRDLASGVEDAVTRLAGTVIDRARRDSNPELGNAFDDVKDSPRAILDLLFDDSNAEMYTTLAPYRDRLLVELGGYYDQAPMLFEEYSYVFGPNTATAVEDFVAARDEEVAAGNTGAPAPTPTTTEPAPAVTTQIPDGVVDLGEITEDTAQDIFDQVMSSEDESFFFDGEVLPKDDVVTVLTEVYGVERTPVGVEREGTSAFERDLQATMSSSEVNRLITKQREALATGDYGPGSAPIRRFWRYLTESDQEVLDEAEAIKTASDMLNNKENEIRQLIMYDEDARTLFEEDPLRFLEEYSEQLNGE